MSNLLSNKKIAFIVWISAFFLIFYSILNSYAVQSFVGAWMAGLDPKRWAHVAEELKDKPDSKVFNMIYHGDPAIRGVAVQQLAKKNKKEWFGRYEKLLRDDRYEIRSTGRALLWSAVADESVVEKILLVDIDKYQPSTQDYQQIIGMMINRKKASIYPYIVKYAQHNGWRSAAPAYFEQLGDPKALEVLYELKKQSPQDAKNLSIVDELALERLDKAIATLEKIKAEQETKN